MATETQGNPGPGSGQGSGAPGAQQGSGDQQQGKPFTFESEDAFNQAVNRAITGRLKDVEKKLDVRFGEIAQNLTTKFDEFGKVLEGLKPKEQPEPAKGGKDKGEAAPKLEDTPEWKAMKAEQDALKKKLEASEKREAEVRTRARSTGLRSKVSEVLTKAGVPADRLAVAASHLLHEGLVGYAGDDSDDIQYRIADGEPTTLEKGVAAFIKSETGRIFLPPQNPGGSGGGPGRVGGAGGNDVDSLLTGAVLAHASGRVI